MGSACNGRTISLLIGRINENGVVMAMPARISLCFKLNCFASVDFMVSGAVGFTRLDPARRKGIEELAVRCPGQKSTPRGKDPMP